MPTPQPLDATVTYKLCDLFSLRRKSAVASAFVSEAQSEIARNLGIRFHTVVITSLDTNDTPVSTKITWGVKGNSFGGNYCIDYNRKPPQESIRIIGTAWQARQVVIPQDPDGLPDESSALWMDKRGIETFYAHILAMSETPAIRKALAASIAETPSGSRALVVTEVTAPFSMEALLGLKNLPSKGFDLAKVRGLPEAKIPLPPRVAKEIAQSFNLAGEAFAGSVSLIQDPNDGQEILLLVKINNNDPNKINSGVLIGQEPSGNGFISLYTGAQRPPVYYRLTDTKQTIFTLPFHTRSLPLAPPVKSAVASRPMTYGETRLCRRSLLDVFGRPDIKFLTAKMENQFFPTPTFALKRRTSGEDPQP